MEVAAGFRQWAHQGGAKEGPSNTLWAMRRAKAAGANALEFDVHLTRDRRLVLAHDRTLGRVSRGHRWIHWIRWMRLDRLQQIDAAYWWVPGKVSDHHANEGEYQLRGRHREDPALRIPTLEEVLDDPELRQLPLTVEVKSLRAAKPLAKVLNERGRHDVTVTAFFTFILWRLRAANPAFGLAPATAYALWFRFRCGGRRPPTRSPYQRIQVPRKKWGLAFIDDDRFVAAAQNAGLKVDAWTIDAPWEMRKLFHKKIDGIMTDCPSVLAEVVRTEESRS